MSPEELLWLHTDLDVGGKSIKYILAGEGAGTIFAINELTGDIHAMKRLDREEKAEYTLTAQVINAETDEPLEPPSEFIIKVQDINDNPPQFVQAPYQASVPEMSAVGRSLCPSGGGDGDLDSSDGCSSYIAAATQAKWNKMQHKRIHVNTKLQ
ncbi:Cadherin-8 Precursor [Takifugu flavidus]|uniref:Cadherin-8 n=1 Tax=Takifugu flavidus TaxID=433684 RepID=A0A5C6NKG3_9TELE|nr:Cadherin-8 Precursor [Takifugu flavidus]